MNHATDTVEIRPATGADIAALGALLAWLFAQEADFTPDAAKQERGLRLILEQSAVGQIYCAEAGEVVVGMVSLLFTVSTAEGGQAAWLEDMVVHPDWRGRGIGSRLLE